MKRVLLLVASASILIGPAFASPAGASVAAVVQMGPTAGWKVADEERQPPMASIQVDTAARPELSVWFDGTGSSADQGGSIVSYSWDFGDGSSGYEPAMEHVYAFEGVYTVNLTVTDDAGLNGWAQTTVTLVVTTDPGGGGGGGGSDNQPPYLGYTISGDTVAPAQLTFDAGTSGDPDGYIAYYNWYFSDGGTDYGPVVQRAFVEPGSYSVTLEAVDDQGASSSVVIPIEISAPEPPVTTCRGLPATILGHGQAVIMGTKKRDVIVGTSAAEEIHGASGDDVICGEGGADHVYGEKGDDVLSGGEGPDAVIGDAGDDTLIGDAGSDVLNGGKGRDHLLGGTGEDSLDGGDGNDQLSGDDDNDVLWGQDGRDDLRGGAGADQVWGGPANDTLYGEAGDDALHGDEGNDWLNGGPGVDELDGGTGRNTLIQG